MTGSGFKTMPYSCLKCEQKLNLNHKLNKSFRNQKRSLNSKCNSWHVDCSILYRAPRKVEFLHHLAYFLLFPISLIATMKILSSSSIFIILLIFVSGFIQAKARVPLFYCGTPGTRCNNQYILCPFECPSNYSHNTKEKFAMLTATLHIARPSAIVRYDPLLFIQLYSHKY